MDYFNRYVVSGRVAESRPLVQQSAAGTHFSTNGRTTVVEHCSSQARRIVVIDLTPRGAEPKHLESKVAEADILMWLDRQPLFVI
jgi:hypothetical protein